MQAKGDVCEFYEQYNRFSPERRCGGGGQRLFIAALLLFEFSGNISSSPSCLWVKGKLDFAAISRDYYSEKKKIKPVRVKLLL